MKAKRKVPAKKTRRAVRCSQIVRLSKDGHDQLRFSRVEPCRCECLGETVFKTGYEVKFKLDPNERCDETHKPPEMLLPPGAILVLEGTLTVRQGKCPRDQRPIRFGSNEGKYAIYRQEGDLAFEGTFCGTIGVNPSYDPAARCCAYGEVLGCLCGEGTGRLKGWSLYSTYNMGIADFEAIQDLCEPPKSREAKIRLDGVLIRPCPEPPARRK